MGDGTAGSHAAGRRSHAAVARTDGGAALWNLQIKYYGSDFGPGPGFFSFWLGVLVVFLSLCEIARSLRKHEPLPAGFFPDRAGLFRIASLLGALIGVVLLLNRLGYALTMFLLCGFLLRVLGRQPWWLTAILTLLGSFDTA